MHLNKRTDSHDAHARQSKEPLHRRSNLLSSDLDSSDSYNALGIACLIHFFNSVEQIGID